MLGSRFLPREPVGPDARYTYAKATVTRVVKDYSGGEAFKGIQLVQATVTSGEYKGRGCELQNPNDYQNGALCADLIAVGGWKGAAALYALVFLSGKTGLDVVEILCGICGTMGVVLTVPAQSAIAACALRKK